LSTHPDPGDRNATVSQLAKEWKQKLNVTTTKVNRNEYLKRIEGLIYGEDPKGGYLENNVFYHPVLKFQFAAPQNWAYQNSPSQVQLASKDGKALIIMTLAQGKSLQEAANAFLQQNNLQALESRESTVNGLRTLSLIADQKVQQGQQQQAAPIRAYSQLIQYGDLIYLLMGVSRASDFNSYSPVFQNTLQSFRELTDPAKLNKKADRVRLKTVSQAATLEQVLRNYNVPANRLEEMAILNGMPLSERVNAGTLIKVIQQ
jgi:predicted Zn-dependent protease